MVIMVRLGLSSIARELRNRSPPKPRLNEGGFQGVKVAAEIDARDRNLVRSNNDLIYEFANCPGFYRDS